MRIIDIDIPSFRWNEIPSAGTIANLQAQQLRGELTEREARYLNVKIPMQIRANREGLAKILTKIPTTPGRLIFMSGDSILGMLKAEYDMLESFSSETRTILGEELTYPEWLKFLVVEVGYPKVDIRILR